MESDFRSSLAVNLLFDDIPTFEAEAVLEALRSDYPKTKLIPSEDNEGFHSFVFEDLLPKSEIQSVPPMLLIATAAKTIVPTQIVQAIRQSWQFPEARTVAQQCHYQLLASEFMGMSLPYQARTELFRNCVLALSGVAPCLAMYWRVTDCLVDPELFKGVSTGPGFEWIYQGFTNVRLFNVEGTDADVVMDVLGLGALGLPDPQCHFRGLDPNEMANYLYNIAYYLYEHGDVISDGHTIEGILPSSKWTCQHEKALIQPDRVVLDINPGRRYAAGKR